MDGESEGLSRQVARLDLTIKAEMEKCKVLQVSSALSSCLAGTTSSRCIPILQQVIRRSGFQHANRMCNVAQNHLVYLLKGNKVFELTVSHEQQLASIPTFQFTKEQSS